jgi:hypothetical protein
MATKHQENCYRTFDGARWPSLCDVLDESHKRDVAACKAAGVRVRMRKHPDGYHQAFYHPGDDALIGQTLRREGR